MKKLTIAPLLALLLSVFNFQPSAAQFPHEKTYNIDAVSVSARGEDRAYRIMRNAIASAPRHGARVAEYSAGVYLKGSFDITKVSSLMMVMLDEEGRKFFRTGENYTLESWNQVDFTAPDRFEQRVVKQMNSLPASFWGEGGASVEEQAMRMAGINIYDPELLGGLVISPLSPGAFNHYRFRYEGWTEDGGLVINKIAVIPVRKSQQLVSGHIFVAEDLWSVHGLDIAGSMKALVGMDFRLQSDYGGVGGVGASADLAMPTAHRITFDMGFFGSSVTMRYLASVDYTRVVEAGLVSVAAGEAAGASDLVAGRSETGASDCIAEPVVPKTNRQAYRAARKARRAIEAPKRKNLDVTEEFEDNFTVTVDSAANVPDPGFWDRIRPEPLAAAELEGYRSRGITTATTTPDSAARRGKTILGKILTGAGAGGGKGTIRWHGLMPSQGGFNTVDGFYFGLRPLSLRAGLGKKASLEITPEVVWAIDRHVALGDVAARLRFAPRRRGEITLRVGVASSDFNGGEVFSGGSGNGGGGIRPIENTVASLFFRRNYLKLYSDEFAEATARIDLANGLALSLNGKIARRRGLENHSDYSFFFRESRAYTPNFELPNHRALTLAARIEYTPRQYYRVLADGRRQPVRSAWPTFFGEWQRGVPNILGSSTDFEHLSGGAWQNVNPGPGQRLSWQIRGGGFFGGGFRGAPVMHLPDWRHFAGGDIPFVNSTISGGPSFRLLPYYRAATPDRYIQAHASYVARFLVLKLLPWFSNRLWMEGLQINYLSTPAIRNYTEAGYTVGLLLQAGVFVGFEGTRFHGWGVKLALPINIDRQAATIAL